MICESAVEADALKELQKQIEEFARLYPKALKFSKLAVEAAIVDLRNMVPAVYHNVLMMLNIVPYSKIDTMAVDMNGNLFYNPMFVVTHLLGIKGDELETIGRIPQDGIERVKGVLVHEAMHIINYTFRRMRQTHPNSSKRIEQNKHEQKDLTIHTIGNYAYDLTINRDLLIDGIKLPDCGVLPVFDPPLSVSRDEMISQGITHRKAYFEFNFTTSKDTSPDIRRIDITRFSAEKCFTMFVVAMKKLTNKLHNQGLITPIQYIKMIEYLDEVLNDE